MNWPPIWKYRLEITYNDGRIQFEEHTCLKSARFSITCSKRVYQYNEEFVNRKIRPISYTIINTCDNSVVYEYFVNKPKTSNKKTIKRSELIEEIKRLYKSMYRISQTCVNESKQHISSDEAISKIRELIYLPDSITRNKYVGEE